MTKNLIYTLSSLRYDIDNLAYIVGQRTNDERLRQRISDVTQKNNMDRVIRKLALSFAEIENICYPYTKVPAVEFDEVADIIEEYQYVVTMNLPCDTNQSTVNMLREGINEYVTWSVLVDWLTLNAPELLTEDYRSKTEEIKNKLHTAVNFRNKACRIKATYL